MRVSQKSNVGTIPAVSSVSPQTATKTATIGRGVDGFDEQAGSSAVLGPVMSGGVSQLQSGDWWQALKLPPRSLPAHASQAAMVAGQSIQDWLHN
jgi:hypothetical protein